MHASRKLILIAAGALLGANVVWAHGDPVPQRGGILQVLDELDFELVIKTDKIDLYTSDDNEPVPSKQMSGTLTIMGDSGKTKVALEPAGINRLRAIEVTAASGSRVIAIVTMPDGKSLAVTFAIP